jgi:tRNA (cytidine/uridine-2'-O-)-methyltransferase
MVSLAVYHPQIPQNTGTLLRLTSCLGVHIDLIRPFGFVFNDTKLKRAGMDYIQTADYEIYDSFDIFLKKSSTRRVIAMEANDVSVAHNDFRYRDGDILMVGSEHYGFLPEDLKRCSAMVKIPMVKGRRSINMAISASIVLSEAMSQLNLFPKL